ncbi:MAG: CPBP family intramembrane metalloprotease [Candidatus Aenigmarchaeota archaeon]|nr:CPBP family intramembrane metalloprotease [Candidatus Aenigmarchaeota archaeon]
MSGRNLMNNQIIRILFYNAIVSGLGLFLIRNFFNSPFNEYLLAFLLFGLVIFDSVLSKKKLNYYGIKKPNKNDIKLAFVLLALFFPISIISRVFFPNFDIFYAKSLGLDYQNLSTFLIFSIPIAIVVEEIGMRSLLQSKLSSVFSDRWAIYITITNFALIHFGWFFYVDLTSFLIILFTVLAYSMFLAILFYYTKNIFLTITTHLLVNVISSFQIVFHINNQIFYELILWILWGIYFILLSPIAINLLRKGFDSAKARKLENVSDKLLVALLSIFSLLTILFLTFVV